jgi:hypothetical protein
MFADLPAAAQAYIRLEDVSGAAVAICRQVRIMRTRSCGRDRRGPLEAARLRAHSACKRLQRLLAH